MGADYANWLEQDHTYPILHLMRRSPACGAGDGALCSFQLHRSAAVGIGQHRLRLRVSSLQSGSPHPAPPAAAGGELHPPRSTTVLPGSRQAQVIQLVVFQRVHPHA